MAGGDRTMIQPVVKLLRSSLGFKRPKIFRTYYKDIKELDTILSKLIKPSKQ
jgi:uncharacterized membrane protein